MGEAMVIDSLAADMKELLENLMGEMISLGGGAVVREHIVYKLLNRDLNRELLGILPHRDFLDLAIVYSIARADGNRMGAILVNDMLAEKLGLDEEDLWELARENTPRLFPAQNVKISDFLGIDTEQDRLMQAMTNSCSAYGAGVVLYPGVLEQQYEAFGCDYYILPSSVHEVILLPDRGGIGPDVLAEMVGSINDGMVAPKELLSYSVYRYELGRGMFIAKEVRLDEGKIRELTGCMEREKEACGQEGTGESESD